MDLMDLMGLIGMVGLSAERMLAFDIETESSRSKDVGVPTCLWQDYCVIQQGLGMNWRESAPVVHRPVVHKMFAYRQSCQTRSMRSEFCSECAATDN